MIKKHFLLFSFLWLYGFSFGQVQLKVYDEKTENGYIIYGENKEFCPTSVSFDFNLKNLKSTKGKQRIFVIPAQAKKFEITRLEPIKKNKVYGFNYNITYTIGDHFLSDDIAPFSYNLPFLSQKSYTVQQGYNGAFSHQNKNALDFNMPIGSKVLAIRDGVVVNVEDSFNKSCPTPACSKFNNYITVYHGDGTFAEYTHIKYGGAQVKVGQTIKQNDFIAYSGNVGWSSGPHLHLEVFAQKINERKTLAVKFKINNGNESNFLKEDATYIRNY